MAAEKDPVNIKVFIIIFILAAQKTYKYYDNYYEYGQAIFL